MRKSKLLVLLLVFAMVFSAALAGCGSGDTPADENPPAEDTNEEETTDTQEEQDTSDEGGDKMASEQVLKVNWRSEPPSLDPQISQDATSSRILIDTLEGMIRMSHDAKVKEGSGMAKSWDVNEDGTEYTFHLRDANWTDGEPVTADDFKYSWTRALDPATGSTYAFIAYDIKNGQAFNNGEITDPEKLGLEAVDDKTLKVTLERPNPAFLSKLQHSTFLPARKDLVEEYGDKYMSEVEYMVFNGPFVVSEWEHESHLNLEKNPDYWNADSVKLDKVEGAMVKDSNTVMNLYETGELDYVNVPSQYIDQYRDKLETAPEAATFYYTFNTENEFFANKKIRKAFAMAIDREKIQQVRTKGLVPPAFAFVPPGLPGPGDKTFREANGNLFYDLGKGPEVAEEAKKLLDEGLSEIGKTKEDMNGIKFLTYDSDNSLQRAQIWQQYWQENLGIDVKIEQATFKIKIDRENKGDFAFSYSGWIGDYNDPMTFMDMWVTGGSQNTANWSSEEYDRLIKKSQTTTGEERMNAMLEAEKILMEAMPIAPTDHDSKILLVQPYVKDVIRLPLQVTDGLAEAYVTEN